MKSENKTKLGRRDFLRVLGAGAAATAAPLATPAAATESNEEERKARYKANSAEVQTFYRVNSYPKK